MAKGSYSLLVLLFVSLNVSAQLTWPRRDSLAYLPKKTVPADFRAQRLPFFCRLEYQLQKTTRKNLFIRLGSKQYVDYLEQKKP